MGMISTDKHFSPQYNPSFTAKCPQIRDGEWVCHKINEEFPHFSTSKFKPMFQKKLRNVCGSWLVPKKPMSIEAILYDACAITNVHCEPTHKGIVKRVVQKLAKPFMPKRTEKDYQVLGKISDKIEELGQSRVRCMDLCGEENPVKVAIKMLKDYKLGNCFENALIAELVMKMNGVENARTLYIKNGKSVEHSVCAFNKDGSKLDKIVNNKTIIIDPWAQKTDYGNNMMVYLKNQFGNNLAIDKKSKLGYEIYEFARLNPSDIEKLRAQYPSLVYNSSNRKFMAN